MVSQIHSHIVPDALGKTDEDRITNLSSYDGWILRSRCSSLKRQRI